MNKPPLGLKPLWLHNYDRVIEILNSLFRYSDAGLAAPKEWLEELRTLIKTPQVIHRECTHRGSPETGKPVTGQSSHEHHATDAGSRCPQCRGTDPS